MRNMLTINLPIVRLIKDYLILSFYILRSILISCILRAVLITASMFALSPNSLSRCSSRIPWGRKCITIQYNIQIDMFYSLRYCLPDLQVQWQRLHPEQALHLLGFPWSPSGKPARGSSTRRYARTWREASISLEGHRNFSVRIIENQLLKLWNPSFT